MKKELKILLPLLVVALLFGSTMTQAYGVSIGNTFTYDVEASSWDVTVDTDTSSGTGFNFLDVNRPVGSQFTVEVTDVTPATSVDWEMTLGTDTDTGSSAPFDAIGIIFLMFFPMLIVESSIMVWNQTEMDLGLEIMTFFFAEPTTFTGIFEQMVEENIVETYYTGTEFNFENVGGTFDQSSSTAVFEWHFDMTYVNGSDNWAGDFTWQYAYDKTTGQMKGNNMDIDYSGTMGGIDIVYKLVQKVEEVGYDLPNVAGILPGFEWFIVIPIVAILGGFTIIRRKRK